MALIDEPQAAVGKSWQIPFLPAQVIRFGQQLLNEPFRRVVATFTKHAMEYAAVDADEVESRPRPIVDARQRSKPLSITTRYLMLTPLFCGRC
jgi:hypothetical protein